MANDTLCLNWNKFYIGLWEGDFNFNNDNQLAGPLANVQHPHWIANYLT